MPSAQEIDQEVDVVIVGAGPSGLSAAFEIQKWNKRDPSRNIRFAVLEGRDRYGGRINTDTDFGYPVDLGASYMHGCGFKRQYVFDLAIHKGVESALVPGYGHADDPDSAHFWHGGAPVDIRQLAVYRYLARLVHAVAANRAQSKDPKKDNIGDLLEESITELFDWLHLPEDMRSKESPLRSVIDAYNIRAWGYVGPLTNHTLQYDQGGSSMFNLEKDPCAVAFRNYWGDEATGERHTLGEDVCLWRDVMTQRINGEDIDNSELKRKRLRSSKHMNSYERFVITQDQLALQLAEKYRSPKCEPEVCTTVRKQGTKAKVVRSDRFVVHGYGPFLVDHLLKYIEFDGKDRSISLQTTVKAINEVRVNDHTHITVTATRQHTDVKKVMRLKCRRVIVTVPLSILKQSPAGEAGISFESASGVTGWSKRKQAALANMAMGIHNKIILRYEKTDVFWPEDIASFQPLDARFRWLNLHAYGHVGMLRCDLLTNFGRPGGGGHETEGDILAHAEKSLMDMFSTHPRVRAWRKQTNGDKKLLMADGHVTMWDLDPYSLGSYSYMPPGASFADLGALRSPEWPLPGHEGDAEKDALELPHGELSAYQLFFAGEHTSEIGFQCVHGAVESGLSAGFLARASLGAFENSQLCLPGVSHLKNKRPQRYTPTLIPDEDFKSRRNNLI
eukprot:Clim_evm9s53 gene=Clim_evmTU9s53